MGDETAFVPGHGPMSTFGHERRDQPVRRRHGVLAGLPDLQARARFAIGAAVRDDPAAARGTIPLR